MKLRTFEKIINSIQKQQEKTHALYKMGIDLMDHETEFIDTITLLLRVYYGKDGEDWISWYLYERPSHTGEVNQAWDKDGTPICYDIPSLWKCVEEIRCSINFEAYDEPTEESKVEEVDLLKKIFGGNNGSK